MNPIVDYLATLAKYPASPKYYPRVAMYLLKAAVMEPFRFGERAVSTLTKEQKQLPHAPVCILGYYRSGTTHLQETMLQDPQFGNMNFYQCFFPGAFNSTESWVKPVCERIVRRIGMLHPAHEIPFSFQLPAEEDVAMVCSGSRLAANWGQVLPRYFKEIYRKTGLMDGISAEDLRAWKDELNDLLFRVSKANGHKKLLLKSPPQLARLGVLHDMYPSAKFVFIRRNPYDVFASNKKLWKSFAKTWLQDVDAETVREYILWSHDLCHQAYERDKACLRPDQLCEISFEEFRADPLNTLKRIYTTLKLADFGQVEPYFRTYLAKTHQASQPPYPLSDVERAAISERLSYWLEAGGYASPREKAA